MRKSLLLMLSVVLSFSLNAEEPGETRELFASIKPLAMKIGSGKREIYAFVDPVCPRSRQFIAAVFESEKLQSQNSYYVFLYPQAKFHSEALVETIYESPDPLAMMKKVMTEGYIPDCTEQSIHQQKIETIAVFGRGLKMQRRPYLIIFEPDSPYCKVSEGTAPCLAGQ
jgi:hypothetical protein